VFSKGSSSHLVGQTIDQRGVALDSSKAVRETEIVCRRIDRKFKTEGNSSYKRIEDAVRIYKRKLHMLHFQVR
jgi:hypothetical protein